jgi:hypothetical protein
MHSMTYLQLVTFDAELKWRLATPKNLLKWTYSGSFQTMLATAIGIHRLTEIEVGRVVMGDNAAGTFFTDFRARTRAFFIQHGMLPAIIFRLVPDCLETPFRIGGGAATFE